MELKIEEGDSLDIIYKGRRYMVCQMLGLDKLQMIEEVRPFG